MDAGVIIFVFVDYDVERDRDVGVRFASIAVFVVGGGDSGYGVRT